MKLMAIANNPERRAKDEADIATFFRLSEKDLLPECFEPLDLVRVLRFAERFRQRELVERYMGGRPGLPGDSEVFGL